MSFKEKIDDAIRTAALKQFGDDFDGMFEIFKDALEIVRAKFDYMTGVGTPTAELYEAMGAPLMAVKLMIATSEQPKEGTFTAKQHIALLQLADAYLNAAEEDFTARLLEVVRLVKLNGEDVDVDEEVSA